MSTRDSTLYNAMIAPYTIGPMALTGFTWYQVRLRDRLRVRDRDRVRDRVYLLYSRGTRARPTSTSGAVISPLHLTYISAIYISQGEANVDERRGDEGAARYAHGGCN